jgi:hypothetical protein
VTKVELFEIIRKEHLIQGKSIRRIARERAVHRRLVALPELMGVENSLKCSKIKGCSHFSGFQPWMIS